MAINAIPPVTHLAAERSLFCDREGYILLISTVKRLARPFIREFTVLITRMVARTMERARNQRGVTAVRKLNSATDGWDSLLVTTAKKPKDPDTRMMKKMMKPATRKPFLNDRSSLAAYTLCQFAWLNISAPTIAMIKVIAYSIPEREGSNSCGALSARLAKTSEKPPKKRMLPMNSTARMGMISMLCRASVMIEARRPPIAV